MSGKSFLSSFRNQVLGIRQGELDLHGRPREITWTRLEETANSNDTMLHVQDAVDWLPGDRIVIAPTGKNEKETEVRSHLKQILISLSSYTIDSHHNK